MVRVITDVSLQRMPPRRFFTLLWIAAAVFGIGALYCLAALVHGTTPLGGPVSFGPWFGLLAVSGACFVASLVVLVRSYRRIKGTNAEVAN
jgi:hypothetical protein